MITEITLVSIIAACIIILFLIGVFITFFVTILTIEKKHNLPEFDDYDTFVEVHYNELKNKQE